MKNILSLRPTSHDKIPTSTSNSFQTNTSSGPTNQSHSNSEDSFSAFTESALQLVRKWSQRSSSKNKEKRSSRSSEVPNLAEPPTNNSISLTSTTPSQNNATGVVKARPRSSSVDDNKNRRRTTSERDSNGQTSSSKSTGLFRGSSLKSVKGRTRTLSEAPKGDIVSKLNIVPGTSGIHNHGNTCYINAIVQLLSHVDGLAKYLVLDEYAEDIHRVEEKNLTSVQRQPRRRDLTDSLAIFMRSLWRFSYMSKVSESFKTVLGTYDSTYSDLLPHSHSNSRATKNRQQDAHELLLFILNTVHEETNQARKALFSRRRSGPGPSGSTGEIMNSVKEVARSNKSRIYSLFSGYQLYYTICPQCRTQTHRVQPYLALSLPIPTGRSVPLYWNYVPLRGKTVKMGLLMSVTDTLAQLRTYLSRKFNINEQCFVFCEMNAQGFAQQYSDEENVLTLVRAQPYGASTANESETSSNKLPGGLFAVELPDPNLFNESDAESLCSLRDESISIIFTHVERWPALPEDNDADAGPQNLDNVDDKNGQPQAHRRRKIHYLYRRFSPPLVLPQSVTVHLNYDDLVEVMVGELAHTLYGNEGGVDQLLNRLHDIRKRIRLHVVDGLVHKCDLRRSHAEFPLLTETVRRAYNYNSSANHGGVPHVKFTISWKPETRRAYIGDRSLRNAFHRITSDPSVAQVQTMVEAKMRTCTTPQGSAAPNSTFTSSQQRFFAPQDTKDATGVMKSSPNAPGETQSIHLVDCLQAYLSSEQLTDENAMECGKCRAKQRMTVRSSLWSTPDILILHLKRFVHNSSRTTAATDTQRKLRAPVEYPLTGLDIRPYIDQANGFYVHSESFTGRDRENSYSIGNDYLYDLIAVCNHQGNLQEGHYKSYCVSPVDHVWRCYDDDKVTAVDKNLIPSQNAYILVYERRTSAQLWNYISRTAPPPSTSTNESGPTEITVTTFLTKGLGETSNLLPHWAYRCLEFPQHCFGAKQQSTLDRKRSGSGLLRSTGSDKNPNVSASTLSLGASRTDPPKRKVYATITSQPIPSRNRAPVKAINVQKSMEIPLNYHGSQHPESANRLSRNQEKRPQNESSKSRGDGARTPPISAMDYHPIPIANSTPSGPITSTVDTMQLFQGAGVAPSISSQRTVSSSDVSSSIQRPPHQRHNNNATTRPHSLYVGQPLESVIQSNKAVPMSAIPHHYHPQPQQAHHNSFVVSTGHHRSQNNLNSFSSSTVSPNGSSFTVRHRVARPMKVVVNEQPHHSHDRKQWMVQSPFRSTLHVPRPNTSTQKISNGTSSHNSGVSNPHDKHT